jgi:LAO/AO transport system kinase
MSSAQRLLKDIKAHNARAIGKAITIVENETELCDAFLTELDQIELPDYLVLGITGNPGAGKSTLTDKLIAHYRQESRRVGIIAIDPTSPISGGAILGDRIRMMKHATDNDVVIRSMATRGRLGGLCACAGATVRIMAAAGCNPIIIETVGVGQSEIDIVSLADISLLVSAPGLGDDIQAMKAGLLEVADLLVINKSDLPGATALYRDLQLLAHEKGREISKTIASTGEGIPALVENIKQVYQEFLSDGTLKHKRELSQKKEVVDWMIEMLRTRLESDLVERKLANRDPRLLAKDLLKELL